ncbi:MAG: tetratricopeptide repeat protein [Pseudomonadales bacterium]
MRLVVVELRTALNNALSTAVEARRDFAAALISVSVFLASALSISILSVPVLLLTLGSSAVQAAKDDQAPSAAQALSYGTMLYEYFQRHHFEALTEYALAERRKDLEGHGTHPKLMEGGVSLAFGMDQKAEAIFDSLLDGTYSDGIESQAWFYLGKIAYQRSNFERSSEVLAEVGEFLPERFKDEYRSMVSQLAVRDGNFTHAEAALERISDSSAYKAYAHFNIGAAYQKNFIRSRALDSTNSDWYAASIKLDAAADRALRLDYAGTETVQADEFRSLADRALLASGYALLQGERYDAAIDRFKRVRLEGPYASQAMLGYGWAEVEQERYELALTPWEHLIGQPLLSSAVQEAYVGIPYVYEKLGAKGKALQGFEQAATRYRDELKRIESAIDTLRNTSVIDLFVVEQPDGFVDWVAARDNLVLNPQTPYLAELLAGHGFQATLTDLRDLYALRLNLESWQRKVATFGFSLESRYNSRQTVRSGGKQALLDRISVLEVQRSDLYTRLSNIESSADAVALLPASKQKLAKKAASVYASAQQLVESDALFGQKKELGQKKEWAHLLSGVALWDAHAEYPENVWKARKNLKMIDETLDAMNSRKASIEDILSYELDMQSFSSRIDQASRQVDDALAANSRGIERAQAALSDMAIAKLSQHHRSIQSHLSQTQLAITRLYDKTVSDFEQALPSELERAE